MPGPKPVTLNEAMAEPKTTALRNADSSEARVAGKVAHKSPGERISGARGIHNVLHGICRER